MKKMKKLIGLLLVVALVGAAIGGTIAYLTDTEAEVNVMTVGKVDVTLEEKQRNADGSALEDFVQGKEITPLVGAAQADKDKWGQPMLENYVDKIVYATNNSSKEAYIRFLIAVPVALYPDANNDQAPLHWNWGNRVDITGEDISENNQTTHNAWMAAIDYADDNGNYDVKDAEGKPASVTIDGEEYWVSAFYMKHPLAGNATSPVIMSGLYLDKNVDYDDETGKYTFNGNAIEYDFSEGVKIPVLLQAVQTDGWKADGETPAYKVAFDEAFGEYDVKNAEEWFADVEAPVLVETADELTAALAKGEDVALTEDIATKELIMNNGATLDGNGKTIDASGTPESSDCAIWTTGGTIENLTLVGDNGMTRGIGSGSSGTQTLTEDLYIDNVTIDSMLYAINGSGNSDVDVYVTNSNIYGWCSYSGINSFNFTNCTLGKGNSNDGYLVVYGTTNFTDCKFEGVFDMGARADGEGNVFAAGKTITFTNCTYDGVKVTADNFVDYFYYGEGDERDFGYLMANCTIIVDGVTVDNSTYVN